MRRHPMAVALLAAALASPADAREAVLLTRLAAVRMAAEQNPQVAAARAEIAMAEAVRGQADAARWPTIALTVAVAPGLQADLVPGTAVQSRQNAYGDVDIDELSVTVGGLLQITQPLYTFGKIDLRREAARHGVDAQRSRAEITRAEVAVEVAELYESVLLARDLLRLFEEAARTVGKAIEQAEADREKEPDEFDPTALLRLRAARTVARLAMNQARAGEAKALAGLRAYLGIAPERAVALAESALEPAGRLERPVQDLVAVAYGHRPELAALASGIAAMNRLADARHADYLPDFFAAAILSGAYTPGRDLVDTRYVVDPLYHVVPALLVGVRWTIQADMAGHRADETRAEAARLAALREWALQGIAAEVRVAYEDVRRAQRDIDETTEALPLTKRWVVRASADHAAGFGEARDLTEAVEAYVLMRTSRMMAIQQLNVGLAKLSQAIGTLVGDSADRLYPPAPERSKPGGMP